MREICEFSTVEDFWKFWSFIPRPSEVFFSGDTFKEVDGRIIDGFSIFKKGIIPDYCDVVNRDGAELSCRRNFPPDVLDTYWENLVLGLIGETIDDDDQICGARVVDKTGKSNRAIYRLELWYRSKLPEVADRLRVRMVDALLDGDKPGRNTPDFQIKKH